MVWVKKDINIPFWMPKENEVVEAVINDSYEGEFGDVYILELLKKTTITIKTNGDTDTTTLQKGDKIRTPSHAILQKQLDGLTVGDKVKIECKGEIQTKRGDAMLYDTYIWMDK